MRQERLAAYADKKAKKPAVIAKSMIILDVKPWDDETDVKEMEVKVSLQSSFFWLELRVVRRSGWNCDEFVI